MTNLAGLPALGLKALKEGKDPARLAAVAALPCVICYEWGLAQLTPTQVHHCLSGRYSQHKAPDSMTISLCEGHHTGLVDKSKVAIHRSRAAWEALFGKDIDWISWVEERI